MRSPAELAFAIALLAAVDVVAQCTHEWRGGYGCPGTNGGVMDAVLWDPDQAGPLPQVVVVAGGFSLIGDVACAGLATWDPATGALAALPATSPPLPYGHCLAVAGNGSLLAVVAGYVGGVETWQVVALGSAGWTPIGPAFPHIVEDLHVRPNGEIVVCGALDPIAGPASLGAAARWSGTAWVSLGIPGRGRALADLANGDLAVASFDATGGTLAAWNGTTAVPLPSGGPSVVGSMVRAPNGVLFAWGAGLWSWNGATWTAHVPPAGSGLSPGADSCRIAVTANGDVLLSMQTSPAPWSPSDGVVFSPASGTWTRLPGGFEVTAVSFVDVPGSGPLAYGWFPAMDGRGVANVARWNGTSWQPLRDGAPGAVSSVAPLVGDRVAIGGSFLSCGTIAAANVAEWTGMAWAPMGVGLDGPVRDLLRLPNGDVLAGGDFTASGATAVSCLARWNGSTWSPFGGGVTHASATPGVSKLARLPNGDVLAGGTFTAAGGVPANHIARWNGVSWSPLGAGLPGGVGQMVVAPNGDVVVSLTTPPAQVMRWDGATWTQLLSGGSRVVTSLAVLADGSAVAGGYFSASFPPSPLQDQGFVTRLSAGSPGLQAIADFPVSSIVALPDGDALVFGAFSTIGGTAASQLARMDGGTTTPTFQATVSGAYAGETRFAANGELFVAGGFFGAKPLHGLARLVSTCPATASVAGNGCAGSGGPNLLTATSLPWIGATLRTTASGMATNGIALGVLGLGTVSLPLAAILSQGVAGCSLLVAPDLLDAYVPVAGTVSTQLAIPNVAALVGQPLHQQFVSLEFAGTAITALTSSNALTLTIGVY